MTRIMILIITLGIITALTPNAKAQTIDGNFLYRQCERQTGLEVAYVTGVIDALITSGGERFSLPPASIVAQNRDIVCTGLSDNPEYRSLPASILVHAYLAKAWPKGGK